MNGSAPAARVRVVAVNVDGSGCVVLYPAFRPTDSTETDDEYYERTLDYMQAATVDTHEKEYVDTVPASLPPLEDQDNWVIQDGVITVVP
jgi:hypothetical protein